MAAKKYYVVWAGVKPGIYSTWAEAERQVKGFPGARFKSFPSQAFAEAAFKSGATVVSTGAAKGAAKKPATRPSSGLEVEHIVSSDVDIFCDGACDPNPGNAGTGIAIYHSGVLHQLWYGLYNPTGTNNTAELLGLYHSLQFAQEALKKGKSVTIHCDSKYSIDCVSKWAFAWKEKSWSKKGGDIKNLDIIKAAHALYVPIADRIEIKHVKGHAGIEGNELADRMSVVAIERQETDLCQYLETHSIPDLLALHRG